MRTALRLETACSIIQEIHGFFTIETLSSGIVQSLVEVGGFKGANLVIDGTVGVLRLQHQASAGESASEPELSRTTMVFIRGIEIGRLITHYRSRETVEAQLELLEFIVPTLFLAIDHAVSFAEVDDYRRTLEDKVVERTAQLADAHQQLARTVDDLREAKAARDRFFANINHEIRTPLMQIQLGSDGIRQSGDPLSAWSRKWLDDVNAGVARLLHLVNSLLLLAAGEEGKLRIYPQSTDVAEAIDRIMRTWQPIAWLAQVVLVYEGPAKCPATLDVNALDTVIGNFVSNAIKHTPKLGRVTISVHADDKVLSIRVRDTGRGIDPEFIPQLFARFERAASASTVGVRGTGIGLALSNELAELQGGAISVERHDNPSGTTFAVVLPRHQTATTTPPPREKAERQLLAYIDGDERSVRPSRVTSTPQATILLAEDDPALARQLSELLSDTYRVLVAPNGRVALDMAREQLPDLLITDLEMPELDGFELTRQFLALQGTMLSPVLIISAYGSVGERLAGFEAGAVDYVVKPFSADELRARVRSQLALRRLAYRLHESESLASMGVVSAGLAHELRNPVNAIVNAIEPLWALLPEEERIIGSAGHALHEAMHMAANSMRSICSNISGLSRSAPLMTRPEDVRTLIHQARTLLKHELEPVRFVEQVEIDRPIVCAGPMIQRVLVNLIDNGAYAAGPGGEVRVAAWAEPDLAVIEITDSGPGVPPHLQNRIFDPFFTTKPIGKGTGLGLTVSRQIALDHGGDLRVVRSARGTAFRLALPASRA